METGEPNDCRGSDVRVSRLSGYLSNFVTEETSRGSATCPWVIEGRPGQRFTLTLVDFAVWSKDGDGESRASLKTGLCQIYAKIREATESPAGGGGGGGVIVCGGERREQLVYTSETNVVRVEITDPKSGPNPAYFLLKYESKYVSRRQLALCTASFAYLGVSSIRGYVTRINSLTSPLRRRMAPRIKGSKFLESEWFANNHCSVKYIKQ